MPQIITLCGIQPEQTDINFSYLSLDAMDAKLLAFDLSRNQSVRTVKCAAAHKVFAFVSARPLTLTACLSPSQCRRARASDRRAHGHKADQED